MVDFRSMRAPVESSSNFTMGSSASLVCACYLVTVLLGIVLSRGIYNRSFFETATAKGDNQEYLAMTQGILGRPRDDGAAADSARLYPGTSLIVAVISWATGLNPIYAFPLTCWIAAGFAWYFACRLYGPMAGALTLCINFSLMERFLYGGPESIVLCLCLGALWVARRVTPPSACAASALLGVAAGVRPVALMFVAALRVALLIRQAFRELAISAFVIAAISGMYFWFIHSAKMAANPVSGYRDDWYGASPVSFPLWPLIETIFRRGETALALAKELAYVSLILAAVFLLARHYRAIVVRFPLDACAFAFSVWFLFSYNSPYSLSEFPRFTVLCIPFACYLFKEFLTDRFHVPVWAVISVCLSVAVFSALSAHNVNESTRYLMQLARRT